MVDDELARLEALCDAATPAPWHWNYNGHHELYTGPHPSHSWDEIVLRYCDESMSHRSIRQRDAEFITASRTAMPRLLAVARAALAYRRSHPSREAHRAFGLHLDDALAALGEDGG